MQDGRLAHIPWLQQTPDPITTAAWQTWVEMNVDQAKDMASKVTDQAKDVAANLTRPNA